MGGGCWGPCWPPAWQWGAPGWRERPPACPACRNTFGRIVKLGEHCWSPRHGVGGGQRSRGSQQHPDPPSMAQSPVPEASSTGTGSCPASLVLTHPLPQQDAEPPPAHLHGAASPTPAWDGKHPPHTHTEAGGGTHGTTPPRNTQTRVTAPIPHMSWTTRHSATPQHATARQHDRGSTDRPRGGGTGGGPPGWPPGRGHTRSPRAIYLLCPLAMFSQKRAL